MSRWLEVTDGPLKGRRWPARSWGELPTVVLARAIHELGLTPSEVDSEPDIAEDTPATMLIALLHVFASRYLSGDRPRVRTVDEATRDIGLTWEFVDDDPAPEESEAGPTEVPAEDEDSSAA